MKQWLIFIWFVCILKAGAQSPAFSNADSLFAVGKYGKAISVYKKIKPKTAAVHIKMAQAYRAQGNLGKAIDNYALGLSGKENAPAAVAAYASLLYRTHTFKKADSVFQNLVKRFPNNPDFHYQLGLAKQQLNDSAALQEFKKAFSIDKGHQKAIYQLAIHQFKQKNYIKVETLGKTALKSYSENAKIIGLLAQNAMALENYTLAAKRFEQLISNNHRSEFIYEKLAFSYYYLGDLEKALKLYQKILVLNPRNGTAYFNSGKINNVLGNYKKAEEQLKKAVELKKRSLDKMYQAIGRNYSLREKYGKAIAFFKLALNENPENIRSQYELAVAADNYYKELQTRLNYYKIFCRKFRANPRAKPFLPLVKDRISQLKKEKFMESDGAKPQ